MTSREKDGGVVILPMNGVILHETWSLRSIFVVVFWKEEISDLREIKNQIKEWIIEICPNQEEFENSID